jgi:hypothetical protein
MSLLTLCVNGSDRSVDLGDLDTPLLGGGKLTPPAKAGINK